MLLLLFPRIFFLFEEKNSENYGECMEHISGCLLDLIFIVNSRLIILTLGERRWLHLNVFMKSIMLIANLS